MKNPKVSIVISGMGAAIAVLVAFFALRDSAPALPVRAEAPGAPTPVPPAGILASTAPSPPPPATAPAIARVAPTPALAVAKPSLAQHRRSAAGDLRREAGPASLVRVGADRTLATVNGVAITLGHLAPLSRGDAASRSMTEAQYAHRLERAIAMELVNQAARDASIGLTAEQEQRLVELRARSAAVLEAARKEGLAWTSVTPEQIEFEVSEARTLMLQQNLIAKAGGPSVVQQAAYAVAVRDLLERLKSAGAIRRWSPGS